MGRKIDFTYICKNLANLSGFPIRHYLGNELKEFYTLVPFPVDPVNIYISELLKVDKSISYYISPYQMYFGVICHYEHRIIIGPIAYITPNRSTLREIAFLLGAKGNDVSILRTSMQSIPIMGLQNFLHMLALINYYINNETIPLKDIVIYDSLSSITYQQVNQEFQMSINKSASEMPQFPEVHNTLQFENTMLEYVENGDIEGLTELINNISPGNIGKTAETYFRQLKNTVIITATLVSRAAIRGGLEPESALSLSDIYIQKVETLQDTDRIMNLHLNMVLDFTDRVAKAGNSGLRSKFVREISNYVQSHIMETIRIEQMADEFFMSRSHLTTRFKKETGQTLSDYIQSEKIREAKRMLVHTTRSILDISNYLGFSSQSHFQSTFKRYVKITPKQFRELK